MLFAMDSFLFDLCQTAINNNLNLSQVVESFQILFKKLPYSIYFTISNLLSTIEMGSQLSLIQIEKYVFFLLVLILIISVPLSHLLLNSVLESNFPELIYHLLGDRIYQCTTKWRVSLPAHIQSKLQPFIKHTSRQEFTKTTDIPKLLHSYANYFQYGDVSLKKYLLSSIQWLNASISTSQYVSCLVQVIRY